MRRHDPPSFHEPVISHSTMQVGRSMFCMFQSELLWQLWCELSNECRLVRLCMLFVVDVAVAAVVVVVVVAFVEAVVTAVAVLLCR